MGGTINLLEDLNTTIVKKNRIFSYLVLNQKILLQNVDEHSFLNSNIMRFQKSIFSKFQDRNIAILKINLTYSPVFK